MLSLDLFRNIFDPGNYIITGKQYLCCIDYNSFRFTCKGALELSPPNYALIIKDKLSKYVPDVDVFLNKLREFSPNVVISGSFILSCLLNNDNYHGIDIFEYDIDTFEHESGIHELQSILKINLDKVFMMRYFTNNIRKKF